MPRKLATFLLLFLLAGLTACSSGTTTDTTQALALAKEMREGCVAEDLEMMLRLSDKLAPLAEARDIQHLVDLITQPGCRFVDGPLPTLACDAIDLGGDIVTLHARLDFIGADGLPKSDPSEATWLRIYIEALGFRTQVEGILDCRPDPERGLVLNGSLSTLFENSCFVIVDIHDVAAQRIADGPGGLRITAGRVTIRVEEDGVGLASGSAALIGRNALVAIEVGGVFSQGEVSLGE